jgi:hypothetical protein
MTHAKESMKRCTQAAAKSPALTTENTETPETERVDTSK